MREKNDQEKVIQQTRLAWGEKENSIWKKEKKNFFFSLFIILLIKSMACTRVGVLLPAPVSRRTKRRKKQKEKKTCKERDGEKSFPTSGGTLFEEWMDERKSMPVHREAQRRLASSAKSTEERQQPLQASWAAWRQLPESHTVRQWSIRISAVPSKKLK